MKNTYFIQLSAEQRAEFHARCVAVLIKEGYTPEEADAGARCAMDNKIRDILPELHDREYHIYHLQLIRGGVNPEEADAIATAWLYGIAEHDDARL